MRANAWTKLHPDKKTAINELEDLKRAEALLDVLHWRESTVQLTVVITAYNEGADLRDTIEAVHSACDARPEILVVDDGSSDGCSEGIEHGSLVVIRHTERIGVAFSRNEAIGRGHGHAIAVLDGHHHLTLGCLDHCAVVAVQSQAIVSPDVLDYDDHRNIMHGAYFDLVGEGPPFSAFWRRRRPPAAVTRISSVRAPPYIIPKQLYPKVRWSRLLRGWGGSEGSLSLKAFFTDTPILHLCGPIAYHKFKSKFHYDVGWEEIWRNHALIARICFSEATWYDYWLPEVFQEHLSEETQLEMDSDAVKAEHLEFQQIKVRPDHEFWTRLAFQKVPPAVKR